MGHAIPELNGAAWRKSSHSGSRGGECIEIAPLGSGISWRKSSHSGPDGGECVEAARVAAHIGVRDSKIADGPALVLTRRQWALLTDVTVRQLG